LFDATMLVMGGMVGAGIFMNPTVVARDVEAPALSLVAWSAGGLVALIGALIYAELANRMPEVGGQYAYLREAYHLRHAGGGILQAVSPSRGRHPPLSHSSSGRDCVFSQHRNQSG
jgi:amino acid transporter